MTLTPLGNALRDLGLGAVRLRYRPADDMITRDTFQFTLDATDHQCEIVGCGDTAEEALADAIRLRDEK